jgi:ubiquinone/menaquinone biosynthesis C-methylase UbiE
MVEVMRRRAAASGVDNLEARVMDMEQLQFADDSFDAVTCRWGYMFCPDAVSALIESRRVLRPGGRLALAVWDLPANNPWLSSFVSAINHVAPSASPPDPKALGPFRLSDRGELEALLGAAGFSRSSIESVPFRF